LHNADFRYASLREAVLSRTDILNADFSYADLTGTDHCEVKGMGGWDRFEGANLKGAVGIPEDTIERYAQTVGKGGGTLDGEVQDAKAAVQRNDAQGKDAPAR
jgi:hypothetical protein